MANTLILVAKVLLRVVLLLHAVSARKQRCRLDKVLKSGEKEAIKTLEDFETSVWICPEKNFKDINLVVGKEEKQVLSITNNECGLQHSAGWKHLQIIKVTRKNSTTIKVNLEGQCCGNKTVQLTKEEAFTLYGHGASYWMLNQPCEAQEAPCSPGTVSEASPPPRNKAVRRSSRLHSASLMPTSLETKTPNTTAPETTTPNTNTTAPMTTTPNTNTTTINTNTTTLNTNTTAPNTNTTALITNTTAPMTTKPNTNTTAPMTTVPNTHTTAPNTNTTAPIITTPMTNTTAPMTTALNTNTIAPMTKAPNNITTAPMATAPNTNTTAPNTNTAAPNTNTTASKNTAFSTTAQELSETEPMEKMREREPAPSVSQEVNKLVPYILVAVLAAVVVVVGEQASRKAVRIMRKQVETERSAATPEEEEVSLTAFEKRASSTTLCLQLSASPQHPYKKYHEHDALLP